MSKENNKQSLRVIHFSDTHNKLYKWVDHLHTLPDADVMVHTGDYSHNCAELQELKEVNRCFAALKQKYPIILAIEGNHDARGRPASETQALLSNCIYLHDSEVVVQGVKFYGASWQYTHWAVQHDLAWVRKKTPKQCSQCNTTHTGYRHWGCPALREEVLHRIKPRVHCFGHVHDDYGRQKGFVDNIKKKSEEEEEEGKEGKTKIKTNNSRNEENEVEFINSGLDWRSFRMPHSFAIPLSGNKKERQTNLKPVYRVKWKNEQGR